MKNFWFLGAGLLLALPVVAPAQSRKAPDLKVQARYVEGRLKRQWLPYWAQTVDPRGGYLLADGGGKNRRGTGYGANEKSAITQARMVWAFSHAHRLGYSTKKQSQLRLARHGVRFLRDVMRDKKFGGYYFAVDAQNRPTNTNKSTYAQAFVVYGLTEFARASRDREARLLALQAWRTLRLKTRDPQFSGYLEHFTRDWKPILDAKTKGASPEVPGLKSANCYLHLMEAGAELFSLTRDPSVKRDLIELTHWVETRFYPADSARSVSLFNRNWTIAKRDENKSFSFGHIIEAAHLIVRARQVLGLSSNWPHFSRRVDQTLRAGYDHQRGGMFSSGQFNGQEIRDHKWWWVQYESLAALSLAATRPGGQKYVAPLKSQLRWIEKMADPRDYVAVEATDGAGKIVTTSKAHPWKAAYHDGRALMDFVATWKR